VASETMSAVQYTFFGKVHPERCNVSIPELRAQIKSLDGDVDGIVRYSISLSQVTATFECNRPVQNVYTLKNIVEEGIRVALDALGYTLACGYDLEIVQVIDSIGSLPVVFGVGIPAINKSAESAGVKFEDIVSTYGDTKGQYLQRCLADLREAIRTPKDTGFFCYRGIESLRQFFLHEMKAKSDSVSWESLRCELAVERGDIEIVKGFADPIRHGGSGGISDEERAKVFTLTWNIVNKFIKYANRGYQKS
jgi:hypothetical protein